jgi:hypothetical protein
MVPTAARMLRQRGTPVPPTGGQLHPLTTVHAGCKQKSSSPGAVIQTAGVVLCDTSSILAERHAPTRRGARAGSCDAAPTDLPLANLALDAEHGRWQKCERSRIRAFRGADRPDRMLVVSRNGVSRALPWTPQPTGGTAGRPDVSCTASSGESSRGRSATTCSRFSFVPARRDDGWMAGTSPGWTYGRSAGCPSLLSSRFAAAKRIWRSVGW